MAVPAVNQRNQYYSLACVSADSKGVMTNSSAAFHPAPVTSVKVHVGSANVAGLKIHKYLSCLDYWFGDILDFDVVLSSVDCGFQKCHSPFRRRRADLSLVFLSCFALFSQRLVQHLNLDEYSKERLWQLLVDAVHASVMYPTHKAYTRDTILPSKADVHAVELSERLGMPLGEALVILDELAEEKKTQPP